MNETGSMMGEFIKGAVAGAFAGGREFAHHITPVEFRLSDYVEHKPPREYLPEPEPVDPLGQAVRDEQRLAELRMSLHAFNPTGEGTPRGAPTVARASRPPIRPVPAVRTPG